MTSTGRAGSSIPVIDIKLDEPLSVRDSYRVVEEVRRSGPIVYNVGSPRGYLVTSYQTCQRVLGGTRQFLTSGEMFVERFGDLVFEGDPTPKHDRVKGIFSPNFTREHLAETQSDVIQGVVRAQLEPAVRRLRAGERIDVVDEVIRDIPELVIGGLLGIPRERFREFVSAARLMALWREGMSDPGPAGQKLVAESNAATATLNALFKQEFDRRAGHPLGSDLISLLISSEVARDEMTEREMIATCTHLVFAAGDTTAKVMAEALMVLQAFPDQRELLRQDRSLMPAAIEELIRFVSPAQTGPPRVVAEDGIYLEGVELQRGELITPLLVAANRDPSRWDDPAKFDIRRPVQRHLGFGFGMHSCLGLNMARLEIAEFIGQVLDTLDVWQVEDADYGPNFAIRGAKSAILTIDKVA